MSPPVPSERVSDFGGLPSSLGGGGFSLVSIGSEVCNAVRPEMVVNLSPFHGGVADKLEPELFVIEQPAQPMVDFGCPDNNLLIGQHGR